MINLGKLLVRRDKECTDNSDGETTFLHHLATIIMFLLTKLAYAVKKKNVFRCSRYTDNLPQIRCTYSLSMGLLSSPFRFLWAGGFFLISHCP
jgi:hypothetical protein